MRRGGVTVVVLVLALACGGEAVAVPFPDGQNGTQLVLAILAQAKALEAAHIGGLEIQVGG